MYCTLVCTRIEARKLVVAGLVPKTTKKLTQKPTRSGALVCKRNPCLILYLTNTWYPTL